MCVSIMHLRRRTSDLFFFFQAEDGIRDLVRSRGLGDVYKRQVDDLYHDLLAFLELVTDVLDTVVGDF